MIYVIPLKLQIKAKAKAMATNKKNIRTVMEQQIKIQISKE